MYPVSIIKAWPFFSLKNKFIKIRLFSRAKPKNIPPAKRFLKEVMVVTLVMALVLGNRISKKTTDHFHQGGIHTDLFYIFLTHDAHPQITT